MSNTADENQVKEQGRKERDRRKRELDDLDVVLATAQGRRVFRRLLDRAGVHESVLTAGPGNVLPKAGQHAFALFMLSEIKAANLEAYFAMEREAKKESEENS